MADNTRLNPGAAGDLMRSVEKGAAKAQVVVLDLGGAGAENLADGAIPVTGTFFQATQPVSGTFWQATQPVSFTWAGLTDAELRANPVPVSLTSTEVSNFPATQAVTGTFWQATQPVSFTWAGLTDAELRASAVAVNEPALLLTGAAAQTAVVNNILSDPSGTAATDVANYRAMSVQVVSTGTAGTFIFEQSNDNTNFVALPVFNAALVTGVPITAAITATASSIIYTFPIRARYVRLRIATTITGGSIRAFARVSTEPWTAAAQLVASNTAANLNATVSGTVTVTSTRIAPNAADGHSSHFHLISAATTNDTLVLTGARSIGLITATNTNAAARYLKVYNKATAPASSDTPIMTVLLPPGQTTVVGGNSPIRVPLGLGIRLTTGIAAADTGAVSASEHSVSIAYT
jgi:hypothetical protein